MKNKILKCIFMPILIASHGTCLATAASSVVSSAQTNTNINLHGDAASYYFFSKSSVTSEKIIGESGGVANLEDFFSISFSEKSLTSGTKVVLSISMDQDIDLIFNETTLLFRAIERLPQEIRVNVGKKTTII